MDQWNTKLELHQHHSHSDHREMAEVETKDTSGARKVQKADREKLRRERLNEQFVELGNVLDPDRPKNDKASILLDTIQVLKDLATEVNRLKAEVNTLSEESSELTQEKNELREEKSSLKSDIENLNAQYQQRAGVMFPWGAIDPSTVMMPPPYSFPVAMPVHSGPVPVHPFPYFANHNPPGAGPASSPAFIPYPAAHTPISPTVPVYAPTSYSSSKQERGSMSSDRLRDNSSDVVTELELKIPGSRSGQESSSTGDKKGKQPGSNMDGVCSSSRYICSQGFQDSSSNSVVENDGGSE